jgi:putative DNA primase/helicase
MSGATGIAVALGNAHRSGAWWRCLCPVHGSRTGRSATLALRDGEHGIIAVCHAGCSRPYILAELRRRGLLLGAASSRAAPIPTRLVSRDNAARRAAVARRIWAAAHDARRSPVATYLAGRGITIDPPPSLRWAPRCWHGDTSANLPAMIARVEHVERGLVGCHRTYLTADYRRRDRASFGLVGGGAVRLASAGETLMIGEGIETTLAAMQACDLPGWAALSTSGMVRLALPPIVCTVVILADHDENGAGERAARLAADRWLAEGRRVRIAIPPKPGIDFADVLLGRSYARITEARNVAA